MSFEESHRCPTCAAISVADDEFCESCGADLARSRDAARDHIEVDLGSAAGVTDRGRVHRRNEDALFLTSVGDASVVVVCDGVSMSVAPQAASQVAAEVAGRSLAAAVREARAAGPRRRADWDPQAATVRAVVAAHDAVLGVPWMDAGDNLSPPSCTVVSAVWDGATITVGWAGDSRAYWLGQDGPVRMTVDHSWAQEQVDAGWMSQESASADRRAHAITRWLGADAPDDIPQVIAFQPTTPGRLIACSDGLWNYVADDDHLAALVGAVPSGAAPIELARVLTRFALERGGRDNITVAVVDVTPVLAAALPGGQHG